MNTFLYECISISNKESSRIYVFNSNIISYQKNKNKDITFELNITHFTSPIRITYQQMKFDFIIQYHNLLQKGRTGIRETLLKLKQKCILEK